MNNRRKFAALVGAGLFSPLMQTQGDSAFARLGGLLAAARELQRDLRQLAGQAAQVAALLAGGVGHPHHHVVHRRRVEREIGRRSVVQLNRFRRRCRGRR